MDEHVQRLCEPLVLGWQDYGAGRATLADLSRLAEQARHAMDGSAEPRPDLLWVAELELLALYDEAGRQSDRESAQRLLEPIFDQIGHRT